MAQRAFVLHQGQKGLIEAHAEMGLCPGACDRSMAKAQGALDDGLGFAFMLS